MTVGTTKLENLVNPQVMADMISAKLPSAIKVTPFAKIDTTLVGVAGNTVTVPQYKYIGDAEDVAEGEEIGMTKLESTTTQVTVKKAGKGVTITDEAVLSGYGDPVEQATMQLGKSIASKIDVDSMEALQTATKEYDGSAGIISYDGVVNAIDLFEEEDTQDKIMYVHPKQVTQLRKDPNFQDKNKYPLDVIMNGVIGRIAGAQVVTSKKVKDDGTNYICPIVQLTSEEETDTEIPALTIYLKRAVEVEAERSITKKETMITADEHYTASLSNDSKVVKAKFKKMP